MADINKVVPDNTAGNFFVRHDLQSTAIRVDSWRLGSFADQGEFSFVFEQPQSAEDVRAATRALLCCPNRFDWPKESNDAKTIMQDLPLPIEDNVFYTGFNSPKSYGGNSFFLQHPDGNWLIDSPKYLPHLVKQFEKLGGIKHLFLTHQDDVAEAARYATEFGAQRIIIAQKFLLSPDSEIVIENNDVVEFSKDFTIIPVPGHTRGHMVLLYKSKYLFTGDHLAFDPAISKLYAFRRHCWYSWEEQTKSMARLLDYNFEWVLAGHGDRAKLPSAEMHQQLVELVDLMKLPSKQWYAHFGND